MNELEKLNNADLAKKHEDCVFAKFKGFKSIEDYKANAIALQNVESEIKNRIQKVIDAFRLSKDETSLKLNVNRFLDIETDSVKAEIALIKVELQKYFDKVKGEYSLYDVAKVCSVKIGKDIFLDDVNIALIQLISEGLIERTNNGFFKAKK